jgi:hypothetical protein
VLRLVHRGIRDRRLAGSAKSARSSVDVVIRCSAPR